MESTRSGDVLAGRYRLADLLSESGDGRFWKADDSILGRPVAIHVLGADDPRAPRLMDAARASASVGDARLLRVLDAETTGEIAYVVNEWGAGTSLDNLLAAGGPLPARRAAWVAEEVADTLTHAHELGHAHGRLSPENVLVDELGAVRIIGFAVEAALHGLEPGRIDDDRVDLAGILYAGLTGKWAGRSPSRVPPAPRTHDRVLRPRQVRAGVPRVLDDLCDRVLAHAEQAPPSARELGSALAAYVGDASDLGGTPRPATGPSVPAPPATEDPDATQAMPAPDLDEPTVATPLPSDLPPAAGSAAASSEPSAEPEPTQEGLPSFDDDWDDDWHVPRSDPVPPPPPLEPPTPKPLFADEPRRPRTGSEEPLGHAPEPTRAAVPPRSSSERDTPPPTPPRVPQRAPEPTRAPEADYWPWSGSGPQVIADEPERAATAGRGWLRLAIAIAVAAVLVVCIALAYNATHGGSLLGGSDESPTASPSVSTQRSVPVRNVDVRDFDPYGNPPAEYPDLAHYAVDGDKATTWRTSTYNDQLGPPPGLKTGVGLVLDLKATYAVDKVRLDLLGSPTSVSVYVSDDDPSAAPTGKPAASGSLGTSGQLTLHGAKGRYVTIWLTALPQVADGFRGEVAEVSVTGVRAG
ncbi:protein kinase [Nocardioides sp. DS6]|uniref:Protein kinase n=1 Tax=Nocardioides eburneus TaxID=3231482 RepID=A0ABV3T5S1_9ACTN